MREYTTATSLASAKVSLAGFTDDEVHALIQATSAYVEHLTSQVFNPISETFVWDGRGRRLTYDPRLLPIIEATSVTIDWNKVDNKDDDPNANLDSDDPILTLASAGAGAITLISSDYVVDGRVIQRLRTNWPIGPRMIQVVGVLGWLDPVRAKVTTTTSEIIASNATEVDVVDASKFEVRDVCLIGSLTVILTAITANTLKFDSVGTLPASVAASTAVNTWGKVPLPIERLTNYLLAKEVRALEAQEDGQAVLDPARIRKERTDNYSYELFGPAEMAGGWVTGSLIHDATVRRYARPAVATMI